jgi:hypothetical protein
MARRISTLAVIAVVGMLGSLGCAPSAPSETGSTSASLNESLTDVSAAQATVASDTVTLPLQGNASMLAKRPGDLLVSSAGDGFLRKVVNVTQSGNSVVVYTASASMDEAVLQGDLDITDAKLFEPDLATVGFNIGPQQFSADGVTLALNSASFAWNVSPEFKFHFAGGLKSFSVGLSGPIQAGLDWSLSIPSPLSFNQTWPVGSPITQHYTFWIGWMPVVAEVTVGLNVGVTADFSSSLNIDDKLAATGNFTVGLSYADGQFSAGGLDGLTLSGTDPLTDLLSATLGVKVFLEPTVSVGFYGVTGVVLDSHEWLRLAATGTVRGSCGPQVDYDLYAGADAILKAELSILGYHASSSPLTVFSDELSLTSGAVPACP